MKNKYDQDYMNISIISHGAHGGRGGIDQYIANLIDVLISKKKN